MAAVILPETYKFLAQLAKNNNREWFNERKQTYLATYGNVSQFADALIAEMNKHDELETTTGKASMYRIYSDVRFKKDKQPYNPRFAFNLQRATKLRRGSYYVNIKPGNTFIGCGFWGPNPGDLSRIRQDISYNYADWNRILKAKGIAANFGVLQGEKVLTAPRGYAVDNPGIDLLRHKQFLLIHPFTDVEVTGKDFLKEVNRIFKAARPWLNYMSDVLTTDANGERIV